MTQIYLSETQGLLARRLRAHLQREGFSLRLRVDWRGEPVPSGDGVEPCFTVPRDPRSLAGSFHGCAVLFLLPSPRIAKRSIEERLFRRWALLSALEHAPEPPPVLYLCEPPLDERLERSIVLPPLPPAAPVSPLTEEPSSWLRREGPGAFAEALARGGAKISLLRLGRLYDVDPRGRLLPPEEPLWRDLEVPQSWLHIEDAVEALLQLWLRAPPRVQGCISGGVMSPAKLWEYVREQGTLFQAPGHALADASWRLLALLDRIGLCPIKQREHLVELGTALSPRPLADGDPLPLSPDALRAPDEVLWSGVL